MKTKLMLLLFGSAIGIAWAAARAHGADLQPMIVTDLTGELRIVQNLPLDCSALVKTTPVSNGRLELSPAEGVDVPGGKLFALTRANVTFAPFTIHGSCHGESDTRNYTAVSVQLAKVVSFTATPAGGGVYNVAIPKGDFLIYEAATVDGKAETGYKQPIEDVTGTIDLTLGIVTMRAVVGTKIHLEAGCVPGVGCLFSEDDTGTLTATLAGTIVFPDTDGDGVPDRTDNCRFVPNPDQSPVPTPTITAPPGVTLASCVDHHIGVAKAADVCDGGPVTITNNAPAVFAAGANLVTWSAEDTKSRIATATQIVTVVEAIPPTVSCTAVQPLGNSFQVSASDNNGCAPPTIRLGSFVLANDEVIKIDETGQAGVRLIGTIGPNQIRFFHVGKGQAVVTATDGSGNVSSAVCR